MSAPALAALVVVSVLLGAALGGWVLGRWVDHRAARALVRWQVDEAADASVAAGQHSRAVVAGSIAEQVAPLLPDFPWAAADARFLGRPVDYVVFDGWQAVAEGRTDRLDEIVFVDVKTGRAGLSRTERRIRDCILAGAVHCSPVDCSPTDSSPTDSSPTDSSPTDSSPTDSSPTGRRRR